MSADPQNGRTHEPSLRELTSQLDGLRELTDARFQAAARLLDERDRLYLEKFRASEIAVSAAIAASDKQTAASFASSEKAIGKAEQAQSDYNVRSNEFRGQLDDQAKTLMPRTESQTLFKSYEDKLEDIKKRQEIFSSFMSTYGGAKDARHEGGEHNQWVIGIAVVVGIALVEVIGKLWK